MLQIIGVHRVALRDTNNNITLKSSEQLYLINSTGRDALQCVSACVSTFLTKFPL
ncbi:MAG: hypothetical protein VSS75_017775 [Candidatus Parabeggiatoa sp.]|nr:hypothetical protein [Candidatus Parabeggiatoa sp.]